MFTDKEKDHIIKVKNRIRIQIELMKEQPWNTKAFSYNRQLFLSGNSIANMFREESVHDYDFFAKSQKVAGLIAKILEKDFHQYISKKDEHYIDAGNAITMRDKASYIVNFYGEPDEVRNRFDYVHCMPYYDLYTGKLFISELQYKAIMNKWLIVNNIGAIKPYRREKFLGQGYKEMKL